MPNIIKQIVSGDGDMQTIRMIVRDNERGPQGEQGEPGVDATISAGNVYTTPAGSNAAVMNTGTSSAAVFDFYIPKGDTGAKGEAATVQVGTTDTLPSGYPAIVTNSGDNHNAILNFKIPRGEKGAQGEKGPQGERGAAGKDGAPGANGKDGAIQYTAGAGIQITSGNVINATGAAVATWGGIQGTLSNQTDLKNALDAKQGTLTAGNNISISDGTISATDTKYTAGANVSISDQNVISATDTTYSVMTGATDSTAGTSGLTPAPAAGDEAKFLQGDGTWATPPGKTYTAGTNVSISDQNVISATDTTYSAFTGTDGNTGGTIGLVPAPATTDANKFLNADGLWETVSIPTVNDATLTIQQNGTDVATFTANASTNATANITSPIITMTTADPGEGAALSANNYVAVYGGDPIIMDYSTIEVNTGATWIDGSPIYKKTINFGTLPDTTSKTVPHGITNLSRVLKFEGYAYRQNTPMIYPLPFVSKDNVTYNIGMTADDTNLEIGTGTDRSNITECYVTLYYTKSS